MTLSEILTVIVLALNFIALCVVAYQTYLTRNSLKIAKETIDETRKARQLEILPRANFVICVIGSLERWLEDVNEIVGKLEKAVTQRDQDVLRGLSKQGLKSPKNLIDKFMYEHAPNWLSAIWVTGAQYYYDCKAPMCSL
ncbi:MAG: hypothetical protein J7J76_01520 [Candidatus Latescibacteria bacterium]|nr:hypothetical protein [Candidatus Latescibacterota bacterium]